MIRKKGSLIIENMLASAIIMLLLLVICQSVVCKGKWQEMKKKKDEFERITYAVEEELKYNLSIEEVKGLAYNNIISLDKDNSIATLIDYKHVDFKGKIMTLNEWGCLITGWKSIRIYQYCCKVGEEETLQQKRIKYIKEIANNIEE